MPRAQYSNATIKVREDMPASADYQFQAWLQIPNGWDEAARKRVPMTPEQQQIVNQVHQLLSDNNIQLQVTIKKRVGTDVTSFPAVCYADIYCNKPEQEQQPAQNNGGGNASGWGSMA